jgi:Sec-independent protein translocase protein TatA
MEFLGIGPLELLIIILIGLIVLGPKDIVKAGQSTGRFLRKIVTSPYWSSFQRTSREIKNLPNRLIREAGLEEINKDLSQFTDEVNTIGKDVSSLKRNAWKLPPDTDQPHKINTSPDPDSGTEQTAKVTGSSNISYSSWLKSPTSQDTAGDSFEGQTLNTGLDAWITPAGNAQSKTSKSSTD